MYFPILLHIVPFDFIKKVFYRKFSEDTVRYIYPVNSRHPGRCKGVYKKEPEPMKQHGERGYTFAELMIVMVVLGILAALALPNLSPIFSKDKLRTSTSAVTSSLYQARTKAVNEGAPFGVQFTGTGEFYVVSQPRTTPVQTGVAYRLEEGVTITENTFVNGLVIFNVYGQLDRTCLPSGDMSGRIILSNGLIDSTKVEVTFISGRIRETNL
jgi:prepilin-type N-terminal cleavage/methylation domain-containing protein